MEHTRTITRDYATGDQAVLHVESRSGAVNVEGHDSESVHVEAIVHVWSDLAEEADEAASLVERGIEHDRHRVIARAPSLPHTEGWSLWGGRRGSRVDYHVRVPQQTAVRVLSRSGRVQISGTQGRVHVESMSGRCSIRRVQGDVTVTVRSGGISLEQISGAISVEAKSGRIEASHITGDLRAEARSGSVDLRDIRGDLAVSAHTGAVSIDDARGAVRAQAHTGMIRYRGGVHGDFDMKAHTGLIHLVVDPEKPFFLDAESTLGAVRSDLPPRRGGAGNGTGPKVRLRTHTGAIKLTRA